MGTYAASRRQGEEGVSIAEEIKAIGRATAIDLILGYACDALGDRAAAEVNIGASATLARKMGDKARLSFALNVLAGHYVEIGNLDVAEPLFEEALALAREGNDHESIALGCANLARVVIERVDAQRAQAPLAEGVVIAREIGSTRGGQDAIEVSAGLAVLRGEWAMAARFSGALQRLMEEARAPPLAGRRCVLRDEDREGGLGTG